MALGNPKRSKPGTASKGAKVVEITQDEWAEEIDRLTERYRTHKAGWTLKELCKRADLKYDAARLMVSKMIEGGDVEIVGTGPNNEKYYREVGSNASK